MPLGAAKAALLGAAGSGGDLDAITWIAGVNGTGSSGTLEFTGIPQTYNSLRLVLSVAQTTAWGVQCTWTLNGDTSSEYRRVEYYNASTSMNNYLYQPDNSSPARYPWSYIPDNGQNVGSVMMEFPGYTQTSGNQQSWAQAQVKNSNTTQMTSIGGVTYAPTVLAAVTSIACKTDHASYHWQTPTRLDLYGIGSNA